jgi:outer membrane cobalamin receptor
MMFIPVTAKRKAASFFCAAFFTCLLFPVSSMAVDTELLFVGEDVSTLSIASMKAETPEDAPAVASIISEAELEKYGIRTLGEALSMVPGFYIAPAEWGEKLYMRGVPNSVLFLYDTVPLTSDGTKSISPLGEELSLAPVKRIEIIRGPGAVLWGADAFAGIVNIVPLRGRDVDGIEMGFRGGMPDLESMASLTWGKNAGNWEGLVSLSVNQVAQHDSEFNVIQLKGDGPIPVPPSERFGNGEVKNSTYFEALFNFSWRDIVKVSGRWSESNDNYVMNDVDDRYIWPEKKEAPFRFLKIEGRHSFGKNNFTLKAWYNELYIENRQVDMTWSQKNRVYQGELLYDREIFHNQGLFTLGTSWRYNRINGAPLQKLYMPDYIDPGNIRFIPVVSQKDYSTNLSSFFSQYKHHWADFEAWAGIRLDNHSQYDLTFSNNIGVKWKPAENWYVKALYGTAFRTPYNNQLVSGQTLDPEEVNNASVNLAWKGGAGLSLDVTAFWNRIYHHIQEEPYAYSRPGRQDIYGLELKGAWRIAPWLNIWANATLFSNYGDDEEYKTIAYYIIKPDGTWIPVYRKWSMPFDTGASGLFNAGMEWTPADDINFTLRTMYVKSVEAWYDKGNVKFSSPARWEFNLTGTVKNVVFNGLDFQASIKNIFDRQYTVPGAYGTISTTPLQAYMGFTMHFR